MKVKIVKHHDTYIGWCLEKNTYLLFDNEQKLGWSHFSETDIALWTTEGLVELEGPLHVYWHITNACNFPCSFCAASKEVEKDSKLKLARDCSLSAITSNQSLLRVDFSGGEALLFSHLLKYVSSVKEFGIATTLTSNGWLLEQHIESVYDYFDWIIISIDGPTAEIHDRLRETPGSFDRAIRAARQLARRGKLIRINTVVSSKNYKKVRDTVILAKEIGANQISLMQFRPVGEGAINRSQYDVRTETFYSVAKPVKEEFENNSFTVNISNRFHYGGFPTIQPDATVTTLASDGMPIMLGSLQDQTLKNLWLKDTVPHVIKIPKPKVMRV